jgi:hypothetical protein
MLRPLIAVLLVLLTPPVSAQISEDHQFDISGQPSPADWEYFFKLDETTRMKLWAYHQKRERKLGHWSWEWRLAWVRTCMKSDKNYCEKVIEQALEDKALVVRAETATRLGTKHAGSKNRDIVNKLAAAFQHPGNQRNGRPMYIQQRILYAISEVGGDYATQTGARLASTNSSTSTYWGKLRRI